MSVASGREQRIVPTGRAWVRHDASIVERIAFAYQPVNLVVPFLRILPLALDASMLVNQVAYVVRTGRSGLLLAADLGLLRLYVGETICDEVERNLIDRASSGQFNARHLLDAWRVEVMPRLRVVDTRGVDSPDLARLFARGASSDRPTALLSLALGAQLTLAEDRDLLDERYAVRFSVAVHLIAPRHAAFIDLTAHYALVLSAEGLTAIAQALRQTLATPGRGRTIALVLAGVAVGVLTVAVLHDAQRVGQTVEAVARHGVTALGDMVALRLEADRSTPEPILPSIDAPLWLRTARLLALAPAPLASTEIAQLVVAPRDACESVLRSHALFVAGRDGWQLGDW